MTTRFRRIRTGVADRWDLVAYRAYGDATKIEPIMRANPQLAGALTTGGTVSATLPALIDLRVPILPEPTVRPDRLPPWKRGR